MNSTIPVTIADEARKLYFQISRDASKGFKKTFKVFIKPLKAPQKKCENKN